MGSVLSLTLELQEPFMTFDNTLGNRNIGIPTLVNSKTTKQWLSRDHMPVLTMEQLRNLNFESFKGSTRFTWTPTAAFEAREAGKIGSNVEYQTLHDYLTRPEFLTFANTVLLNGGKGIRPRPNRLMTVYLAADQDRGSTLGVVLPGASVTEMKSLSKDLAFFYMRSKERLISTEVYPDELVTREEPHDFTYVPRSLSVAYTRYIADVTRLQKVSSK